MNKIRLAVLGGVVGILAACSSTPNQAPVVERTTNTAKPVETAPVAAAAAAVPSGPGYYTVKKGDTLYRIALEVGQSYRDLVAWNNLTNPNDIKVDQVLRVAPPDRAGTGPAQTAMVTPTQAGGIEVKPLGAPGTAPAATAAAGGNKTGPRGDKRAYSDSALAELERPDAATAPAVAAAPAAPKAEQPHAAEKPATAAGAASEDEGVSWMWPAEGKVVGTYEGGKKGVDIAGKSGQAVMAAGAGKIMYAGSGIRGYGNLVIIKHTNNLLSAYAHNKTILVKEGQSVTKGQKIAEMGNSDSDSVKLHFEIRQQGKPVDPAKYLPPR
ncbi:peptidoglycan DD-metalloendopeptidase family protein [Herbaspirillum sp. alder98]|uniref:peptidoglycan DD-metalloendopeptidase family protein n=1 Tax=Herbaspirillum sp. alder98 TaxID=2913096 RepID=UPI001CD862A2|nr:peptidoglycan DD-metalloendopeptidase family protein [Herbaspirillum sp. alder98]MCA1325976.1 peptidoglycan DD-metalloendopeptidase family protein [Herbaspirillum sp. alder98]